MKSGRSLAKLYVDYYPHAHVDLGVDRVQFYNAVLFMGSVAVFSVIAQKLNAGK